MLSCGTLSIAFDNCRVSWGGATIRQSDGKFYLDKSDAYAVTTGATVELPENVSFTEFYAAVNSVTREFPSATYIGVFHDDAKGTIDINPVEILESRAAVDEFALTHTIIGGAYHFATGDGYWPQGRPELYA